MLVPIEAPQSVQSVRRLDAYCSGRSLLVHFERRKFSGFGARSRGRNENPYIDDPHRDCLHSRRCSGGHEQRLQEQPACVVRSDDQLTAPHKNWLSGRRCGGEGRALQDRIAIYLAAHLLRSTYRNLNLLHTEESWICCAFRTRQGSHRNSRDSRSRQFLCST